MNDTAPTNIENKIFSGHVVEVKQEDRNGVPVGIIICYIATWDLDRGDGLVRDQFEKGAFRKSIKDLKSRDRQLRFKDHHGRTIGGFPADTLKEDVVGLFGRGEINLEVQQGREAYLLAKQGVLTEMSAGFTPVKDTETNRIRTITEAIIWEGSIVDEPMNPKAVIIAVKNKKEDDAVELVKESEVKEMTKRDLEDVLRTGRGFTKEAARTVASLFNGFKVDNDDEKQKAAEKEANAKIEQEEKDFENINESLKECFLKSA